MGDSVNQKLLALDVASKYLQLTAKWTDNEANVPVHKLRGKKNPTPSRRANKRCTETLRESCRKDIVVLRKTISAYTFWYTELIRSHANVCKHTKIARVRVCVLENTDTMKEAFGVVPGLGVYLQSAEQI